MASANLDLVRSIYAALERGEILSSAEWAHPEIEFVLPDGPDPGSWKGLAAMGEAVRGRLSAWEDVSFTAEEYRELDSERVLVLVTRCARGKRSGLVLAETWTKGAHLLHVRDGKVNRLVDYWDRENALADLGLPSETGSSRS